MAEPELLRRAAQRAADQPFFLAWALLAYAQAERIDDQTLAARLGCPPASLASLLICRRPSGPAAQFRADLIRIARRFDLDHTRLAEILRLGEALRAMGKASAPAGGLLAAARDRDPDAEPPR